MIWRVLNLAQKELIQFFRDRQLSLFTLLGPTLILTMVAGVTASHITAQPTAIVDLDHSPDSRQLVTLLDSVEELWHTRSPPDAASAQELLDSGEVVLVVIIPPGFATDLRRRHRTAQVQVWADGTNLLGAFVARAAAEQAITRYGADVVYRDMPIERRIPVDLRARLRFNPAMNSGYNAIPAQLAQVVYLVALLVSATGISKERERGTMEQLMVTPLERSEIVLGKAVPVVLISAVDFVAMLGITILAYDVPMRGSWGALFLLTLLFIFVEMGWGMVISAVSTSQQQSLLMVFMLGLFDMAFSGYLVAVENMPRFLQLVSMAVPLRYYMEGIRIIMIKGGGLREIWPQCAAIVLLNIVTTTLAVLNLQKRLD